MAEALRIAFVGIDIGKKTRSTRRPRWTRRHRAAARSGRGQVEARFANIPPCLIGMEACVGAHHLSRRLQRLGTMPG